ncbi:MAG: CoA-acylating methylmalonate-semialdehyde dehydrogenase [Planctomycetes bacterium]|nr:CoA-acylating methylmalonate-semialdehyde dehydrogenase [Planctomycetota bacterium]
MAVDTLPNYINGLWVEADCRGLLDVENPSTGRTIARAPLSTGAELDRAVKAARAAFDGWRSTPVGRRVAHLYELRGLLREHSEEISRTLVEEMGKSLPDARAELKRAFENVEVACGMPVMQQGDKAVGASYGIDGEVLRLPVGVFAMICPFNFPAMVPFWFLPYALATGNTFVLKPSEQAPCTFHLITKFIDRIDLPPGVFNVVHGDRAVGEAMLEHPGVDGMAFVGSTPVAKMISERCAQNGKRCVAMAGAKNHLVAMPDADVDQMIRNMVTSCFGCAGQRCMAASAIVAVGDEMYDTVCERFVAASREVIVADPLDPEVADEPIVMGPVISARAKERILGLIEDGVKEGAHLALDGREIEVSGREGGYFIGPTVFTDAQPGMKVHRTEIFGPVVVILKAGSLDEAIGIINDQQYGNGASIYTRDGYNARKFKLDTRCGMIGVNIGIPAPVAHLPFGGMKASLFADIKAQGKAVINFLTQDKIITERYWPEA